MDEVQRARARAAALAAVLLALESGDEAAVGRQQGVIWAHDHRMILAGHPPALRRRAARSSWR